MQQLATGVCILAHHATTLADCEAYERVVEVFCCGRGEPPAICVVDQLSSLVLGLAALDTAGWRSQTSASSGTGASTEAPTPDKLGRSGRRATLACGGCLVAWSAHCWQRTAPLASMRTAAAPHCCCFTGRQLLSLRGARLSLLQADGLHTPGSAFCGGGAVQQAVCLAGGGSGYGWHAAAGRGPV